MIMTVSRFVLDSTFKRAKESAEAAGLNVTGWQLQYGSKITVHYRLTSSIDLLDESLGATMIEANDKLTTMARAWDMVAKIRTKEAERERMAWTMMIEQARALPADELQRHASVSINSRHRCENCYTCACAAVLDLRKAEAYS
jgi:hypothetical protein